MTVRPPDEFAWIASLRPLARGDPAALNLADDAAILPARPGLDLVISQDAMVEGVHFLPGEAPDVIARRLLRTSLSDLAAKAADPYAYFLMTAFPPACDEAWRAAFAAGLAQDSARFGLALLGGDTVSTVGPLALGATVLGWVPRGKSVLRSGARRGDILVVWGTIGDGWLGLKAARGEIDDPAGALAMRYRLPEPLFGLRDALRHHAHAAADVSDGLLADAGHIAQASGLGVSIDLDALPLSPEARAWLDRQPDPAEGRVALAVGGDDYAIVCAVSPERLDRLSSAARQGGGRFTAIGVFDRDEGVEAVFHGQPMSPAHLGWLH